MSQHTEFLPKSVDVRTYTRPMRVAFLVSANESQANRWTLDGIFAEAYSWWGGARTLIIPYENGVAIDAIDRLPQTGDQGIYLKQQLKDKLVEHREYIVKFGKDLPEINEWQWSQGRL